MTTVNHWGKWVDSEVPVTGVHSIHDLNWDAYDYGDEICLDCNAAYKQVDEETPEDEEPNYDFIECDGSHTKLFGDWTLDTKTNQYEPTEGETEFAAIMNETTIQVVWSKFTGRHSLCSPCFVGQTDNDSVGEFLGYELPSDLLYKEN